MPVPAARGDRERLRDPVHLNCRTVPGAGVCAGVAHGFEQPPPEGSPRDQYQGPPIK
jgi:hypothetical protein